LVLKTDKSESLGAAASGPELLILCSKRAYQQSVLTVAVNEYARQAGLAWVGALQRYPLVADS